MIFPNFPRDPSLINICLRAAYKKRKHLEETYHSLETFIPFHFCHYQKLKIRNLEKLWQKKFEELI